MRHLLVVFVLLIIEQIVERDYRELCIKNATPSTPGYHTDISGPLSRTRLGIEAFWAPMNGHLTFYGQICKT
jgi:hypothetical protein